jgi:membrane carboxypeptidase/penicillin-binding protein PbpC
LDNVPLNINANTITITSPGNYHVIAANGDCEATSETVTLSVIPYPNVDLNVPLFNEICEGDQFTISVPAGADTYEWFENGNSTGIFTNSITVNQAGNYSVIAANSSCVATSETTQILVKTYPDVTLSANNDLEICENETTEISIPSGAENYEWYLNNVPIGQNANLININQTGNYFVIAANGNCEATSQSIHLEVVEYPDVTISLFGDQSLCDGETMNIVVPIGAENYQWFDEGILIEEGINALTVSTTGNYSVIASNSDCIATSEETPVTLFQYPNVELNIPLQNSICEGENLQISVEPGADGYVWFEDDEPILPSNLPEITVQTSGNYYVTAVNGDCSATSETVVLEVIAFPETTLSVPTQNTLCEGETLIIKIPKGADSYQWFKDGNALNEQSFEIEASEAGEYYVLAMNQNCVSTSETVTIEVNSYPSVAYFEIPKDTICEGETLIVEVQNNAESYQWFLNGNAISENEAQIEISQNGTYHLEAANGDCMSTSIPFTVAVLNAPDPTLSTSLNNEICENETLNIAVPFGASSYKWYYNGDLLNENSNEIEVNLAGKYFVEISNSECSILSETVNLTINTLPNISLSVPTQNTICSDEFLTIEAVTGASAYNWYFEENLLPNQGSEIQVNEPGNYYLEAQNGNCEATSETISLEVIEYPNVGLNVPLQNEICEDEELNISIEENAESYQWFVNDQLITENGFEITTSQSGSYYVEAANGNCISTSETVALEVLTYPNAAFNVPLQNEICEGEELNIAIEENAEFYQWFLDGNMIPNNEFEITTSVSGAYQVEAANGNCVATSETVSLAVIAYPNVFLNLPLENEICEGEELNIAIAENAESYQWYLNGALIPNTEFEITTSVPGDYFVEAANGICSATSETVNLIVHDYPNAVLNVPTQNQICEGQSLLISALTGAEYYDWYFNGALINTDENEIEVDLPGEYFLVAKNGDCADTSEIIFLDIFEMPDFNISPNQIEFCEGESAIIQIPDVFDNYQWYFNNEPIQGATEPTLELNEAGEYYVEVTLMDCSNASNVVSVEIFDPQIPSIDIDNNTLTASNATFYQWFLNGNPISGANNQTYEAFESGDYAVEIIDQNGCSTISNMVNIIISKTNEWILNWNFNLYPNPTNGIVSLEFELSELVQISKIEVVNNLGQVVYFKDVLFSNNHIETIDLEYFTGGIYWVKIIDNEGKFIAKKLVVN